MRRHHIHDIRPVFFQGIDLHTAFVHIDRLDLIGKGAEYLLGAQIGRILHGHDLVPPQNLFQKHQQVIVARADDDLFRSAFHSPGGMQISAKRLAQLIVALRLTAREQVAVCLAQNFLRDSFPGIKRKALHLDIIRGKINIELLSLSARLVPGQHRDALLRFGSADAGERFPLQSQAFLLAGHLHHVLDGAHKIPPAGSRLDVAFVQELTVCGIHGTARNLQKFRQRTRGGKPLACEKLPFFDFSLNMQIYLLIQANIAVCL